MIKMVTTITTNTITATTTIHHHHHRNHNHHPCHNLQGKLPVSHGAAVTQLQTKFTVSVATV